MKYNYDLKPREVRVPNKVKSVEGKVVTLLDSKDREFKVSLECLNDVMKYSWKVVKRGKLNYVNTAFHRDGKSFGFYLHRYLLKVQIGVVDHINHDGTDNTLSNIRIVSQQENLHNLRKREGFTSKYLGVSKSSNWKNMWRASFANTTIGHYKTEDEAALAYNIYKLSISPTYSTINHIN